MNIPEIVNSLTLEEKASLTSGATWWLTKAVERLGVPQAFMADGPHGLRITGEEGQEGSPAVCFPAACLTAASFDRGLLRELGAEIALQAAAEGLGIVLGPGVNIKRSPLCGRNFEYFSEDPYLAGELAAAFVKGLQSENIGASVKHFFANNQEHRRMDGSSELDERTIREIYLPAFENVVKNAKPWTVMASYNKINGTFATESKAWLKGVLRDEWGFDGVVISDWRATHNRAGAVAAGCDLTMPAEPDTDNEVALAVNEGRLTMAELDEACTNILKLVDKCVKAKREAPKRYAQGHAAARKIAAESIILLKNENQILPLDKNKKIAFIGEFAKTPRFLGGGSSRVTATEVTSALDAAAALGVTYAQGYSGLQAEPSLIDEAVNTAKQADIAVIFAGLPEELESEGFDRTDMKMPDSHNRLIEAVCAAVPNTVVVLHNGAPVEMPWADLPKGIIEAYLGGQAMGLAVCDCLFGVVNPSGRLPESVPYLLEHNPSHLYFKGEDGITHYKEGVFIGYRYYTAKKLNVRYPFGYGLSYTSFAYSNLTLSKNALLCENDTITVTVDVQNTGELEGKEAVLLFTAPEKKEIIRPIRELRAFDKVSLKPAEKKTVSFTLKARDFSYWDMNAHGWVLEGGEALVQICKTADDVLLEAPVKIENLQLKTQLSRI